jgi:hypothetical protein
MCIERFWRSSKYKDIYLKACENCLALYQGLSQYIQFYNKKKRITAKPIKHRKFFLKQKIQPDNCHKKLQKSLNGFLIIFC